MRPTPKLIRYVCLLGAFALGAARAQTLTLRQAVDQLETLNPDVAIARLKTLETEAQAAAVKSAYLPQVNLQVQGAYQTSNLQGIGLIFPGFPSRVGPYRTFNARPQVTQTLIDFSLLSEIRAARARKGVAQLEARAVREDLAIAAVQLYLQALQADSRIAASTARLATAEAILTQVRDKEQAGAASKLDIARATEQLENERVLQITATRDAAVLRTLLAKAIGMEGAPASLRLEKPEFQLPNIEPDAAFSRRPDLQALEARNEVAALETKAARNQRLPKLSGFGDYGLQGAGPDRSLSTYNVGAALTIPLYTGRRIESQILAASIRQDQAKQEARRARINIQQEMQQFSTDLRASLEALQASSRAARASKEILELATLRLQSGLGTSVDTQIAQSGLASSDDQRIRNEYDVLLAQARLAKASGAIFDVIR